MRTVSRCRDTAIAGRDVLRLDDVGHLPKSARLPYRRRILALTVDTGRVDEGQAVEKA